MSKYQSLYNLIASWLSQSIDLITSESDESMTTAETLKTCSEELMCVLKDLDPPEVYNGKTAQEWSHLWVQAVLKNDTGDG